MLGQKVGNMMFFDDLYFVRICDKIDFENFEIYSRKHQQGGNSKDSYFYKNSFKSWLDEMYPKN